MNKRGEGMERVHSRDSGSSFIEIVVSVVSLGTVCIGVLNAIATAAVGARNNARRARDHAGGE